ncbi:hypothetical protein [Adlercreutzia sp. ZJ154]|uniref:hypothetical protein n=1 Tax=Adlercreutzia sp. ZJ154 TaxID=2709790 RepID=UPI0013EB51A5|nr:hypothetical protein [Adlercreutzia sp. ZJ154]
MANYQDNPNINGDPDSITLRELEPMNSNPYVHLSLDMLTGSPSAAEKEQRKRQHEAERRAEIERQKKTKKHKPQEVRQKPAEPSLHVIIEKAIPEVSEDDFFDDYDYEQDYNQDYDQQPVRAAAHGRDTRDQTRRPQLTRDYRDTQDLRENRPEQRIAYDRVNRQERTWNKSYSHNVGALEQFASKFPSIPNNLMYGVDEPEPSAPASVVLPNGGWNAQMQSAYSPHGAYPSSYGVGQEPYGYDNGYVSQPVSGRGDTIPVSSEPSISVDSANKVSKADGGRRTNHSDTSSGFIKRPWSESAFNAHTAMASASSVASAPAASATKKAVNNPREAIGSTQPQVAKTASAAKSPSISIPSSALSGGSVSGASRTESRPFPSASAADSYTVPRGMGSWKRSAAAVPRDMPNNPRINTQASTVSIKMAPTPANNNASTGNLNAGRESLNNVDAKVPAKGQTYDTSRIDDSIGDSSLFDEAPVSIADGMKKADKKRKRRRSIIIAVVAVLVLAAAVVAFLIYSGTLKLDAIVPTASSSQQSSAQISSSQNSNGAASSGLSSSKSSSNADQSGTVIYEYTATTSDGISYTVNDTVTFNAEGKCQTTKMVLGFPDEASCSDFLSNLQRDYGSAYSLDSQNGANATVTIDISSLKFDREEYEDALRYSVEDLTVLKK